MLSTLLALMGHQNTLPLNPYNNRFTIQLMLEAILVELTSIELRIQPSNGLLIHSAYIMPNWILDCNADK